MADRELPIGARIRSLRGKLLTQQQLADAAQVSVDLIRKLEQGRRHTASIASLHRIARALDVDLSALLASQTSMPSGSPDSGVVAIRDALTAVDDLMDEVTDLGQPATVDEARRVVQYAWGSYWAGKLDLLGTLLPTGLAQLRATARSAAPENQAKAHELLAQLYCVTRCTATRLGQPDLAWLAIRNALDTVTQGADPLLKATICSAVAHQLMTQGRYDESRQVSVRAAREIEPDGNATLPHLSIYGHLLLMTASAAGRSRRVAEANDLLGQSMKCATRLGSERNDYETSFGVSEVTMRTVDIHVVTENFTGALSAAEKLPRDTRLPIVLRARNLYDRAFAHTRLGHDQRALDTVLAAEHMAPDMMHYHAMPRQIVAELLERSRSTRLRGLARRLGVTGN